MAQNITIDWRNFLHTIYVYLELYSTNSNNKILFSDLRPKGRGRPQRILLGVWPDEHIRGVIRAVVFRDSHQLKDEPHMAAYPRIHVSKTKLINTTLFKMPISTFIITV